MTDSIFWIFGTLRDVIYSQLVNGRNIIFNASSGKHVSPLVSYTIHNKGLITTRCAILNNQQTTKHHLQRLVPPLYLGHMVSL